MRVELAAMALAAMALAGEQVHAVVTDPPYHLTAGKKGGTGPASASESTPYGRARIGTGFMGKVWDGGDIAFRPETWRLCWDLLPPGGHLLAFGGTRTFHRMACAIEDAGFEIRDTLMWLYGKGFPKSHNQKGDWEGWGTALKPAWEPIMMARKPLAGTVAKNVLAHRTGALNIDGCRIPAQGRPARAAGTRENDRSVYGGGWQAGSKAVGETDEGRWPANVLHDGSDEVEAAFPQVPGQQGRASSNPDSPRTGKVYGKLGRADEPMAPRGDTGSASRFFYSAKATAADRAGSKHPTVKPIALMRWLVRLVTPPGGTVLDPFAGSGTTGAAAVAEGMRAVLVEAEPEYQADIRRRFKLSEMAADDVESLP